MIPRTRRRFAADLLTLGAAAVGCSAPARDLRDPDTGTAATADSAPACPSGATGLLPGLVIEPADITGYRDSRGPLTAISWCEYFDPDGSKGINALWVIRSAEWCVPCKNLAIALRNAAPPYLARGTKVVEVLVNGATAKLPATDETVRRWIDAYGCVYDVGRADSTALAPAEEQFPTSFFVNPRTLVIETIHRSADVLSSSGQSSKLEALLAANGA